MFFPWFNGSKVHTAMLVLISILSVNCIANTQIPDYRQMAQLAEYIGVDYPEAIDSGEIINNEEYQEMLEFSGILITQAKASKVSALVSKAEILEASIKEKKASSVIQQLCNELRSELLEQMPQATLPRQLLPEPETQSLFQQQCSTCHGRQGKGDGPTSIGLEPPPTDFTDRTRAMNRSILGLYDAISNGIDETAMVAYDQLSEEQRWSLAFYAGSLAFEEVKVEFAKSPNVTLEELINNSPTQLANGDIDELEKVVQLRASPSRLFSHSPSPLGLSLIHI